MKNKRHSSFNFMIFLAGAALVLWLNLIFTNQAKALSAGSYHSFLSGPWELVVKMGFEGDGLRFPLKITDENKPQELDTVLQVIKTPIKVRLTEYVPDLRWEVAAVNYPGEGIVAKLNIKGKDLEQELWLSSANLAKQSMSSSIGGVAIRRLYNSDRIEKIVKELAQLNAIGTISVWPQDSNTPFEYIVRIKETITIPKSGHQLTVLEYMPHYSIDKKTKKIVNLSNEPINPAVKVSVNDGQRTIEKWLWAKFLSSPHNDDNFPIRMQFTDFNLGRDSGNYFLVVAQGTTPWLLFSDKGKTKVEKAVIGSSYPFADKEYSFSIDEIINNAIVQTKWINNSENLINPALVMTIEQDEGGSQTVLELNKPIHYKTKYGTLVLLYRRRPMQ